MKRSRGRPKVENPKEAVTLRLSPGTVEKFKATGDNWRPGWPRRLNGRKCD
ncbi:MAG: BrnA antitoxin family protein [Xanthobacteraceae bacterium]